MLTIKSGSHAVFNGRSPEASTATRLNVDHARLQTPLATHRLRVWFRSALHVSVPPRLRHQSIHTCIERSLYYGWIDLAMRVGRAGLMGGTMAVRDVVVLGDRPRARVGEPECVLTCQPNPRPAQSRPFLPAVQPAQDDLQHSIKLCRADQPGMASYNRPTGGPSRPLIQRPQTSNQSSNHYANPSLLGHSIAGALSAVRIPGQNHHPAPYPPPHGPGGGYWSSPAGGALASQATQSGHPSLGYHQHPTPYGYQPVPNPYGHPAYAYPIAPGSNGAAFPAPAYPTQHYAQYPQPYPQPQPQPQPHHSLPQNPMRNNSAPIPSTSHQPRTTPDGYTISAAYSPSTPQPANQKQHKQPAQRPQKQRDQGVKGGNQTRAEPKGRAKAAGSSAGGPSGGPGGGPQMANCQVEGCTFTGGKRAVREHEEDRHLIYLSGREPAPWSGSYQPVNGSVVASDGQPG